MQPFLVEDTLMEIIYYVKFIMVQDRKEEMKIQEDDILNPLSTNEH